jgi:hypothetical protein
MKQLKFFSSGLVALFMMFSCNSGGNNNSKTSAADTTSKDTTNAQKMPEMSPPLRMTLLIKHKVRNFDKWLPSYEAHDSVRMAYGLHNFVIGRGIKDSNMVLVALWMDDTAKAKQFIMLPNLKEAMQKGGVIGAPTFKFDKSVWHDSSTDSSTSRVLVTHKVKDFAAWKKVFDDHKPARMAAGIIDRGINRSIDDSNIVTTVLVITDLKKAEAFMNSKDLKDKMAEGGVIGAPDVFMYHVVKEY